MAFHWYLQPETLACILSVLLGILSALQPARASIMSIMGPVWVPKILLDTTHMRLQDPSKTLDMLMMLAQKKHAQNLL